MRQTPTGMSRSLPYAEAMSGVASPERSIAELERAIADAIGSIGPMVIAFSGGVDSALVLAAASRFLQSAHVLAVTADSASLSSGELDHCRALAADHGVAW